MKFTNNATFPLYNCSLKDISNFGRMGKHKVLKLYSGEYWTIKWKIIINKN